MAEEKSTMSNWEKVVKRAKKAVGSDWKRGIKGTVRKRKKRNVWRRKEEERTTED